MKHRIIITIFYVLIAMTADSQPEDKTKTLQLYLTGGVKVLDPKYFGHSSNVSPAVVPTAGGGALGQIKKILLGGEFNYTDGKKHTPEFGTIFTGINFNFIGGYQGSLSRRLKFSIQSGFGYSLHHLSVTDKNYSGSTNLNTAIYHNMVYTVPVSIMLERMNNNGTFIGVRAGFAFNCIANEWRYIDGASTDIHTSGSDGIYVQLVLGGLLKRNTAQK